MPFCCTTAYSVHQKHTKKYVCSFFCCLLRLGVFSLYIISLQLVRHLLLSSSSSFVRCVCRSPHHQLVSFTNVWFHLLFRLCLFVICCRCWWCQSLPVAFDFVLVFDFLFCFVCLCSLFVNISNARTLVDQNRIACERVRKQNGKIHRLEIIWEDWFSFLFLLLLLLMLSVRALSVFGSNS